MSSDHHMAPVLIVGASFAGLSLARTLAARQVPYILFEARSEEDRRQRHRFHFHEWAYEPLLKLLSADSALECPNLDSLQRRIAVDSAIGGFMSSDTIEWQGSFQHKTGAKDSFRANRGLLHKLMRKDLEIRWSHHLASYHADEGQVVALFEDGSKHEGSLLVAADGTHSKIRSQLLPRASFDVLDYVVYYGQQRISIQEFEQVYGQVLSRATKLSAMIDGATLAISINEVVKDQGGLAPRKDEARIAYTYSRRARSASDPLLRSGRTQDAAHDIPDQLYQELAALREKLPEPFKDLCREDRMRAEDRVVHWLMRSLRLPSAELQASASSRVVLIGDAAHASPLLTADGANHALIDGLELGQRLDPDQIVESVRRFYDSVSSRWQRAIAEGEERLDAMHPR